MRTIAGEAPDIRTRSSIEMGGRAEQAGDLVAVMPLRIVLERLAVGLADRMHQRPLHDRCDSVDDVGGFGDERCALLEQVVGAGGARIERRAGDGEHFAALLGRHAR